MKTINKTTSALHAGHETNLTEGTRAVPIYQTASYVFNNTDHAANLFGLKEFGYIYSRLNNPTNDILEKRLAAIEGGIGSVTFASGTAAISSTLLTLLKNGDHILASNSLYGGTFNLLNVTLPRYGIKTSFVNANQSEEIEKNINENTKVIFIESIGNPKLDIIDIEKVAKIAQKYKIPLIVDNTIATPYLIQPIDYGANLVIHSLTKYIGGQGNSLGGAVVDAGNFDWGNGNFPEITEPSKGYHGLKFFETFKAAAFLVKLRVEGLRDLGAALSPFNAFHIIQGLETLPIRIKKHSENALHIAKWLQNQEGVEWVNYPGLPSSNYHELSQKYLTNGQSGIVTFGLKGGFEAAKKFTDSTQLFSLLANIGDTKSLIIHPASTTHQQLSAEDQVQTGVFPDLIRLSIGLENVEDLKNDLKSGLEQVASKHIKSIN